MTVDEVVSSKWRNQQWKEIQHLFIHQQREEWRVLMNLLISLLGSRLEICIASLSLSFCFKLKQRSYNVFKLSDSYNGRRGMNFFLLFFQSLCCTRGWTHEIASFRDDFVNLTIFISSLVSRFRVCSTTVSSAEFEVEKFLQQLCTQCQFGELTVRCADRKFTEKFISGWVDVEHRAAASSSCDISLLEVETSQSQLMWKRYTYSTTNESQYINLSRPDI